MYLGSGMTIPYWDFMGSTMVTNNYIRLTPDSQSKQGAIWNSVVSFQLFGNLTKQNHRKLCFNFFPHIFKFIQDFI